MNKIIRIAKKMVRIALISLGIIFIGLVILIVFSIYAITKNDGEGFIKMLEAKDTYAAFGDGRFEIGSFGSWENGRDLKRKVLEENSGDGTNFLISDIEKYIKKGKQIYFIGYYSDDVIDIAGLDIFHSAYDLKTGVRVYFDRLEDVPRYIILNYKTGDIQLYKTLEEIPENDRKVFEQKLGHLCQWMHTCYEK